MPGVSEAQVSRARELDILSYLQSYHPDELKPDGPGRYVTRTHDSLVISKGKWNWNSHQIGGVSALDYLIKVEGMGFVAAVEHLTGEQAEAARSYQAAAKERTPEKWPFRPPRPLRCGNGAVSYLQDRGISLEVIGRCMRLGILFESRYYNSKSEYHNAAVCVFAGKDDSGEIRFAAMRGIHTDLKRDKAGSDKRWSFYLPASRPDSRHLAVFESPIDALSHATIQQRDGWKWDSHRLSLGGTSDVALTAFLMRNQQVSRVTLHLDGDAPGIIAARKIKARLADDKRFSHIRVTVNPPRGGKDYNAVLLRMTREAQAEIQQSRRRATVSL